MTIDDGLRRFRSWSEHRTYRAVSLIVIVVAGLGVLAMSWGVWHAMHSQASRPSPTFSYWNGQYDAKTNKFIHDLRNWVDPSFIYYPHRTAFFDVDNINSDELMLLADNVCRQFSQGVSYHDVDTTVQKHLKAPESPSFHFINQTVETYCPQFGALGQSGAAVTSG